IINTITFNYLLLSNSTYSFLLSISISFLFLFLIFSFEFSWFESGDWVRGGVRVGWRVMTCEFNFEGYRPI
ncbi:MAG: hypothetical protein WCW16_05500, partial [Candidatus Magasanikbacteria bacterium]